MSHVREFFLILLVCILYTYQISLCVNEIILSFFPFIKTYYGYTNANIGLWGVETRLNIFSTSKQLNYENKVFIFWKGTFFYNDNGVNLKLFSFSKLDENWKSCRFYQFEFFSFNRTSFFEWFEIIWYTISNFYVFIEQFLYAFLNWILFDTQEYQRLRMKNDHLNSHLRQDRR